MGAKFGTAFKPGLGAREALCDKTGKDHRPKEPRARQRWTDSRAAAKMLVSLSQVLSC